MRDRITVAGAFCTGDEGGTIGLPAPIMERDFLTISDFHLRDEAFLEMSEYQKLEACQLLYYAAELGKASDYSKTLLNSQDRLIALSAHTTHMVVSMGLSDYRSAYDDLQIIKAECNEGFACAQSDPALFRVSVFCALRVEDALSARIFEFPEIKNGIEELPSGLKAYLGYLQAMRMIRRGEASMAFGVVSAFQKILGNRRPIPQALLHLAGASSLMVIGKTDEALEEYSAAQDVLQSMGAIIPFVEMNFPLLGLLRHYCGMHNSVGYKRIETMTLLFHEGWTNLRRMCGLDDVAESLTPMAASIASLAYLGWRNKEIASFLHISENTVKHQLSESYQRLQVNSRSELRALFDEDFCQV